MLKSFSHGFKCGWNRLLACLLALITVVGMFPATAFAADKTDGAAIASTLSAPVYGPTGSFETNLAGSTGWNGTCLPLPVYDAATGGSQIAAVPASDGAAPVPFALLEYSGGDRVKVGLATGSDGSVTAWKGGKFNKTGWVDKALIFINLPDVLPGAAYNLTNSTGSVFQTVDGKELPGVTGKQFYQARQFNERLSRYEYIVPCMFTLAERLAVAQKAAMANGDTLVIYETFRPAAVQSAVRDSFASLWDSDAVVAADMDKAIAMGYARNQGWFIASGTSNHQAGLAVDMSLAKGDPAELHQYELGGVTYQKYEAWTEYEMPTPMHRLSSAAIRYKAPVSSWSMPTALENWTDQFAASEGAKKLQHYCTDAGLIPLASEWWHYNDPAISTVMAKGSSAGKTAINTKGDYNIDRAYSIDPHAALSELSGVRSVRSPIMTVSAANGDTGGLNPGSAGGQRPTTSNVAWSTDPKRTFLRFTLVEFPQGVVTDLTNSSAWRVVGTPLNVVWSKGTYETWDAAQCRSQITWYNSNALQFNASSNPGQLMAGTVYAYDATGPHNSRLITTADEFQQATGITDQQKEQMFNLSSSSWSTGWLNGDYTSMWGTDPHPVTPNNLYNVYKANDAFVYLLGRLSETNGAGTGWSKEDALTKWSEYVHDSQGNLRTKYRVIIETGGIFVDPDGVRRAYTLREMMAYSLYNNEPAERYNLIWDQASTIRNMAQWMRQSKDHQFLEYPLDETGVPTGQELHSTNGWLEADSFVDSISSSRQIRDTIFSERRSFGLHILTPFNFEQPDQDRTTLEVTKKVEGSIPANQAWDFTVTYTASNPSSYTATKNGADCTSAVTSSGNGLKFSLKGGETIRIAFEADDSFRCEVKEDDPSLLTAITGTGGTADMASKKFTTTAAMAKVTFTNGESDVTEPPDDPDIPIPTPGGAILFKRDARTNSGVGPATFRFSSVTNGDYEFTTDRNGELEPIQWWDPTESAGRYIKPGEYTVTELIPPPNYTATQEVKQIKLELDADGNPIPAGPLVFSNLAKVGLRIVKYDRLSHRPMGGVTFEIFKDNSSVGRYETNGSGEILLTDIEPGTYRAVEVDTGDGSHILDETYQEIELEAGDGIKDLIFYNDTKPGLKLVKVDSSDLSKTIPGARFRIEAVSGDWGPQEFTTDGSGEIDLSDLPTGSYVVTELECPGYVVDDAQRIIHLRANDTAQFVFSNTKKPALRLVKTSADGTPLEGVTFRIAPIEEGSHSLDRTTDANGEILIEGLEPGIYSVVETATLPDHIQDTTEYHVQLTPGRTAELRLSNDKRPSLVISKTDKDTGEPVPGVTFTLRGADGPTITTKPTGEDGKVVITDLLPGVYTVTEQSVPENYILDPTPQTITLFPNREGQIAFQNHQRPTLTISKVDINGKFLPGAIFEVKTKTGVKIGDFTVGPDGKVTVPNIHLDEGYYIITEIQAPEGYILDPTPHEVYLRAGKVTEVSIENEKKPSLTIQKIDSVVGDGVKGAKFEIWVAKDQDKDGTYTKLPSAYYTDANGRIELDNLDTGWYKIVEVEPPAGFMLKDPSEQLVYVEHDKAVTATFENIPKSALVIRKIDSDTGAPLANAWFRVRYLGGTSGSGGTIIGEYQTSSNGNIVITGLEAGTYVVEEISAPHGYVMDTAPQTAYISGKEQDCITLTFTNSKYGSVLVKKVDSVTGAPLSDVQFYITTSDGAVVGNSNGYFVTDSAGTILIPDIMPGTTLVVKETRTRPGYILDEVPQTVKITSNETKTLEFRNQPTGSLLIRKVCSVNPSVTLQDAEFKVMYSDGMLIGDSNGVYRSDENGEVRIDGLIPGKSVIVTETKAPAGFIIDTQSQTVVIQAGKTVTLTMKNQPKGQLIVQKRDSLTGQPLPGAEFRISTAAGCEVGLDGVIGSSTLTQNGLFVTDSNGEIRVTNLAPGAYVLTETRAPDGYVMDSPSTNVVIGASGDTQTVVVTNTPKGNLVVTKYDSVTKKPLEDAEFKITNANGELTPDNEGLTSTNGKYRTDANGQIVLSKLLPGTYIVTETRAPDGYVMDSMPQTVVVNAGDTQNLEFYDEPLCSITIRKIDSVTGKPVPNTEFEVKYSNGNLIGRFTTGKDGTVTVTGLIPGSTVVVTETRVPKGYVLNTTPQTFVVQSGSSSMTSGSGWTSGTGSTGGSAGSSGSGAGGNNDLTFENDPTTTLVIQKFVEGTENQPLKGVEFLVTDSSGAVVGPNNGYYYTDKDGRITITDLEPGVTVTARETKTLEGYVLDGTPQSIKIKVGEVQALTFWNQKAGELVIRKLDSKTKQPLAGVEFELTYAGGGYVDNANGHLSSNGLYTTDSHGEIHIFGVTGTIVVKETRTIPGYTIDESTRIQTVTVNPQDTQTLVFYNDPKQALTIQKFVDGTTDPIQGVTFLVTDSSGAVVGTSNGEFVTDRNGRIVLTDLVPGTTITAKEVRTVDGYVLDTTPQSILIKQGEAQTLTFYNKPLGGLELIKVSESDKTQRIKGVTFEIRKMDGGLVDTITTGDNGRVFLPMDAGDYYAVEIETAEGFKLDSTPHYFTIQDGKTTKLTVTNAPFSGIIIHKVDSVTGDGIYDVKFLVYDANKTPIGEYTTDDRGYIYIDDLTVQGKGKLFIRELEAAPGYELDKEYKTVYVQPGKTIEIEWTNVPITGQFQIYKYAAEANEVTGTPAGAPLQGAVYEISEARSGKVVDYITTDARGVAASRPLPLGRYKIVEVTAPAYWQVSGKTFDETLEYSGQIIKVSDYDKPSNLGVSITKRGNAEGLAGSQMRYDFTVANTSNVPLESFYWHDRVPTDATRATVFTTGTYSFRLNYRILYKTNYSAAYQVLASNLITTSNYSFSLNAIPMQAGEYVTDIYLDFGKVPVGFQSTGNPTLTVQILGTVPNGYQIINRADVGGKYQGTWQTAQASWVTIVRKLTPNPTLPKTGY